MLESAGGECRAILIVTCPVHAQPINRPFSENVDEILTYVRAHQTPSRQLHIYGVLQASLALAKIYGVCAEKAALAAALHDCAKHLSREEIQELQSAGYIYLSEEDLQYPALWHGPAGSWLAKTKFGVEDPEVLDAVEHHTLGHAEPSPLLQVIMAADFTEPTRCQAGVEELRREVRKDLRRGVFKVIECKISDIISRGKQPHNRIYQTMKSLEN